MEEILSVENIKKEYGRKGSKHEALRGITFKVYKGEFVGIMGSSGAGKSTLLNIISTIDLPSSGDIYINGKNTIKMKQNELADFRRDNLGFVFQDSNLLDTLTIKENIELIPRLKKEKSVEEIEKRTLQLLEMVGLDSDEFLNKYPSELSGGQQQRIGVARAIATDAEIILMDEPFSALDPITRTSLQEQLFSLQDELKKTIIFVTHDMDEALKIADKICIMKDGRIAQYDTPENILRKPANDFVKDFIGEDRVWDNPEYIKARDIMIKNPIAVNSTRTVTQGIEIMRTSKVDSLLIIDRAKTLKGIVTVKDMKDIDDKSILLADIMSSEPLHVNEGDNLVEILNVMNRNSVGYIPVISDENKLVGLITRSSLLSVLSEQFLEMEVSVLG